MAEALAGTQYELSIYNVDTSARRDLYLAHLPLTRRLDGLIIMALPFLLYFAVLGIGFIEISAIAGAIELIVGVLRTRAPGMSLARMPIYAWAVLIFGVMVILAFPAMILTTFLLELERALNWPFFDAARGGKIPVVYASSAAAYGDCPRPVYLHLHAVGWKFAAVCACHRTAAHQSRK